MSPPPRPRLLSFAPDSPRDEWKFPARPQPVGPRSATLLGRTCVHVGGRGTTGAQVDTLPGGPDRPITQAKDKTPASPGSKQSHADRTSAAEDSLMSGANGLHSGLGEETYGDVGEKKGRLRLSQTIEVETLRLGGKWKCLRNKRPLFSCNAEFVTTSPVTRSSVSSAWVRSLGLLLHTDDSGHGIEPQVCSARTSEGGVSGVFDTRRWRFVGWLGAVGVATLTIAAKGSLKSLSFYSPGGGAALELD
ncbi:hypothetical protein BJ322DRAFT_1019738 [Thelephora terrestris]|uniref:Uncharacterized protein n=1 Tax=Thelephora terrestris TaxID=56493 RepID=A0A9P6HHT6_9AGAM|nr:hypothetical protein BJ322DRAFT_1019738 [Thelephora terrestris]